MIFNPLRQSSLSGMDCGSCFDLRSTLEPPSLIQMVSKVALCGWSRDCEHDYTQSIQHTLHIWTVGAGPEQCVPGHLVDEVT